MKEYCYTLMVPCGYGMYTPTRVFLNEQQAEKYAETYGGTAFVTKLPLEKTDDPN